MIDDTPNDTPAATTPTSSEDFPLGADRMPTEAEERAAERAAADVELGTVADHEQEMARRGAEVRGEGEIEGVR
ncbi:MAG: hypothetical protein U0Q03_15885 [Acidimicrobiales bacterium]